jgi:hypothetical protein
LGIIEMAPLYRLHFFFDPGSGICLWSDNDAARERFDYPVALRDLPLPESVRRRGYFVMAWYDTFADWDNSPEPTKWRQREWGAFTDAAQEFLTLLRERLWPDFELVDESFGTSGLPRGTYLGEQITPPDRPDE